MDHTERPVSVDFGGSTVSGMHVIVVDAVRSHCGLDRHPVRITEPYQMLGEIEPDLQQTSGFNVDPIRPWVTLFG